ncbi:hypothetical protein CL6EHI_093990B [Entamoeba histolytica]|uniref:Uncharacterized protein n=1 Tax=Entamoeba histolytica TaxID=5759 RepID=A0A175JK93_ENTHI|nr:hypothetical protein CL6EHI_093990B [Entamoeba histolytica]
MMLRIVHIVIIQSEHIILVNVINVMWVKIIIVITMKKMGICGKMFIKTISVLVKKQLNRYLNGNVTFVKMVLCSNVVQCQQQLFLSLFFFL